MRCTTNLAKWHKDSRVQWPQNHMNGTDEWLNVLFSDEKKFNLDGPNGGWAYYWYDIPKEPQIFFSRQQGGVHS